MGENSKIEWTTHTWNPWNKAAGLAMLNYERAVSAGVWLESPPTRPRVFCASLADWLDDEVPVEWLADLLELIHNTPNLDWQLLSKRPQNFWPRLRLALEYFGLAPFLRSGIRNLEASNLETSSIVRWLRSWLDGNPPANVWMGTTVEDQKRADERIPVLLCIPAKVRFLSCEPLLSAVDLANWLPVEPGSDGNWRRDSRHGEVSEIHWVIAGGESGKEARPMHVDWARSLRDQCVAAGVPYLYKQWGEWRPANQGEPVSMTAPLSAVHPSAKIYAQDEPLPTGENISIVHRVGKHAAGRMLDGRTWDQFPEA